MFSDSNIHERTWGRSSALGDKLWGPKVAPNLKEIVDRISAFNEKLEDLGIPYSPITSYWCKENSARCFGEVNSKILVQGK